MATSSLLRKFVDYPDLPENWVWNGYYTRILNSPVLNFFGKVLIRVSYDKKNKIHHAFIPCFIIPYLNTTIYDFKFIIEAFLKLFCVEKAVSEVSALQAQEYFDSSYFTTYYLLIYFLRIANLYLEIPVSSYSISSWKDIPSDYWDRFCQYMQARAAPWEIINDKTSMPIDLKS